MIKNKNIFNKKNIKLNNFFFFCLKHRTTCNTNKRVNQIKKFCYTQNKYYKKNSKQSDEEANITKITGLIQLPLNTYTYIQIHT